MLVESQNVALFAIEQIVMNVWLKVAENNIGKVVPHNVQLMNVHTFQSIAQLHSQQLQAKDGFNLINQNSALERDNYLNNYHKIQKRQITKLQKLSQLPGLSDPKSKTNKSKDSKRTSKYIIADNIPQGSQSKVGSQRTKEQKDKNSNNKFIGLDILDIRISNPGLNKNQDTNRKIDALRSKIIYTQELKKKEYSQLKSNEVKAIERKQVLIKKQKQIQKFTYDYNGEFFASKLSNPQNTLGTAARIKSQFQKQNPKNAKKQKIKPLFTSISNDKIEDRHKRLANQEQQNQNNKKLYKQSLATMFANSLSQDEDVSQGISIKETNSNFYKSKPLKHKITLSEFKKEMLNKKFKEFKFRPSKETVQTNNINVVNRINSYKSQQFFTDNSHNHNQKTVQEQISQKAQPARNNFRYKTIFSSQHNSILSNSKYSLSSNKVYQGEIKISNPSLYRSFCQES